MQTIKVIDGDLETALRKFKKIDAEVRLEASKHEYYLRPGLKRALKSKEAQRRIKAAEAKRRKNNGKSNNSSN